MGRRPTPSSPTTAAPSAGGAGSPPGTWGPAAPRRRKPRRGGLHAALPLAAIGALSLAAGQVDNNVGSPTRRAVALASDLDPAKQLPLDVIVDGKPVPWWFAYKFSSSAFAGNRNDPDRACPFGGTPMRRSYSQRYVFATQASSALVDGPGLIGTSDKDPLGATFARIYRGNFYYVVWNDQFKGDPKIDASSCSATDCASPWGHSKGVLAWDQSGNGVVIQVSTPSWPGSGSAHFPRVAGNTLGCVGNDNDVLNAQHFFALKLSRADVAMVLRGLARASVSTDITDPQLVNRTLKGQPPLKELDDIVATLGKEVGDRTPDVEQLSSGVQLITKPSALHVPPWQFVSSMLGGEHLITATWWARTRIPSTHGQQDVHCWDPALKSAPGEVDVAVQSVYEGHQLAFTGGPNHAKVGASFGGGGHHFAVFGDLNQQGTLGKPGSSYADCGAGQNGRGGMFFVVADQTLSTGIAKLVTQQIAAFPD